MTEEEKSIKRLNEDITKLKNFIAKHKPNALNYKRDPASYAQYKKDFKEWDDLMRL